MKTILLAIAIKLLALAIPGASLSPTHPIRVRYESAADAVVQEASTIYGDLSDAEQEKRARIAFVFAFHESGWQANPKGFNDQGAAVGVMQVHLAAFPAGTFDPGVTAKAVRADLRLGFRVGMIAMRYFETKCGDLRSAMTAFATTGGCPKPGYSIQLVLRRCAEAGVVGCT